MKGARCHPQTDLRRVAKAHAVETAGRWRSQRGHTSTHTCAHTRPSSAGRTFPPRCFSQAKRFRGPAAATLRHAGDWLLTHGHPMNLQPFWLKTRNWNPIWKLCPQPLSPWPKEEWVRNHSRQCPAAWRSLPTQQARGCGGWQLAWRPHGQRWP